MQLRANHLTISRMLLLPMPCYLLFGGMWERLAALALFSALAATDWWDGKLARQQGPTLLGGLLDPLADKMFLAFTYVPLARIEAEVGSGYMVLPIWLVSIVFLRDLCVTGLRSLSAVHGIEFKTAVLAKFKTAIQMAGGGFLVWNVVWQHNRPILIAGNAAAVAVVAVLSLLRVIKGRPVGSRLGTQVGAFSAALVAVIVLPLRYCLLGIALAVLAVTVLSWLQYANRFYAALSKAGWPARPRELALCVVDSVLPVVVVMLLYRPTVPVWPIIALLTFELAAGGLYDLLATKGVRRRGAWGWIRALALFCLGAWGWIAAYQWPEAGHEAIAAMAAAGVSALYATFLFIVHRTVYLR